MLQPLLLDTVLVLGTLALISGFVVSQVKWLTSHGRQISAMVTFIQHETGKTTTPRHMTLERGAVLLDKHRAR